MNATPKYEFTKLNTSPSVVVYDNYCSHVAYYINSKSFKGIDVSYRSVNVEKHIFFANRVTSKLSINNNYFNV